jgi:hypothetical protein
MYIGEYEVDTDTALLSVVTHNSSGVASDADTDIEYSIYGGTDTSVVASGTLSKFNALTGHYAGKQIISTGNGFAASKNYTAYLKAIVDSDTAIAIRQFKTKSLADYTLDGSYTIMQALRIMFSALAGKSSGGGTSTITFRDSGDTKNRISASVTADGNRTSVTLNGT